MSAALLVRKICKSSFYFEISISFTQCAKQLLTVIIFAALSFAATVLLFIFWAGKDEHCSNSCIDLRVI